MSKRQGGRRDGMRRVTSFITKRIMNAGGLNNGGRKGGGSMTHLTIETVECPGCGHTHRIEVDTEKALREAKEAFECQHKDCHNGK